MKRVFSIILLITSSFVINAQELTKDKLIGKWLIVKVGDWDTEAMGLGTDIWQFTQTDWIVTSNNKSFRPELFRVKSNEIILGSPPNTHIIKVIEFSDTKLVTNSNGIIQTLQKIPKGHKTYNEN